MRKFVVLGCMAAMCSGGLPRPASADAPLPIEYFTRYDEYGEVKISPDGKFLAMSMGTFGRTLVAFLDLEQKKLVSGVAAGGLLEIHGFDWVSDTRLIYYPGYRWPGNSYASPTGEISAVDRDGKRRALIYGSQVVNTLETSHVRQRQASMATPTVVSPLRNDDKFVLITEQPWREGARFYYENRDAAPTITRLNVFNGDKRRVGTAPLASARVLVDRNDEVRFAFGFDQKSRYAAVWKPHPRAAWQEFQLPGFRSELVVPRALSDDEQGVLFTGVTEGESLEAIYHLDLQTHEVTKLFGHPEVDIDGVIRDEARATIVGVRVHADRPEFHWLLPDHPVATAHRALQAAFPGQVAELTSLSSDGRRGIAFVWSDVNPGDYYLIDTGTMRAEYLASTRPWVDPAQMRPRTPVRLSARDGLPLQGYLTRPAGEAPHPLVVLPHGGPHGVRDRWTYDAEAQLLASRGYAVLQVNFRGSAGFGFDFEAAGYREWGGKVQDDITDATRWAIESGVTEEGRICIYGGSFGGYAALMGAVREPGLYQCAVAFAGVYDLELMFASGDIPRSRLGRNYLEEVLGNDRALLRERSPVHHAARIEAPVLLIHGREDWRSDVSQSRGMKAALDRENKPHEWIELRGEGHGIYDADVRKETYERILTFLAQYIGT